MDDFFDYITKDLYDDAYSIISRIFPKKLILNKTFNIILSMAWILGSLYLFIFHSQGESSLFFPNSTRIESGNFVQCVVLGAGLGVFLDVFCVCGVISVLSMPALFWPKYKKVASKIALIPTWGMALFILLLGIYSIITLDMKFGDILLGALGFFIIIIILLIFSLPALISDSYVSKIEEFSIIPMFSGAFALSLAAGLLAFLIALAIWHIWITILIVIFIIVIAEREEWEVVAVFKRKY